MIRTGLITALALVIAGCSGMQLEDFADGTPRLRLEDDFAGRTVAHGLPRTASAASGASSAPRSPAATRTACSRWSRTSPTATASASSGSGGSRRRARAATRAAPTTPSASVIVDEVDVERVAALEAEDHPPVPGPPHCPEASEATTQPVQAEARLVHVVDHACALQGSSTRRSLGISRGSTRLRSFLWNRRFRPRCRIVVIIGEAGVPHFSCCRNLDNPRAIRRRR